MMTQRDKLLAKIQNNPKGATFRELDTLLRQHGFVPQRIVGSHFQYVRTGFKPISVAPHQQHVHVRTVLQVLEAVKRVRTMEGDQQVSEGDV